MLKLACAVLAVVCLPAPAWAQGIEYRVLATSKTSTMEKEMNEAGAAGFKFVAVMGGETAIGGKEVVVLLQKGGTLAIMTRFYGVEAPFAQWWYRRDPTHVCFYCEETMRWIASNRGWCMECPTPHVALFAIDPQ